MSDLGFAVLPPNTRMEKLSMAYIRAVAAQAGFACDMPDVDWDSRDGTIHAPGGKRPKLDFQAKAHAVERLSAAEGTFPFEIKIKNYDDLRNPDVVCPQLLFVVLMPLTDNDRLTLTGDGMLLRHCGYWMSLKNAPDSGNTSKVTVHVPVGNRLDGPSLTGIMARIAAGGAP